MSTARPNSDVQTTGWSSTGANVWSQIDETSANTADYGSRLVDAHDQLIEGVDISMPAGTHVVAMHLATTSGASSVRAHILDGSSSILGTSAWQDITSTPTNYNFSLAISATGSRFSVEIAPANIMLDENGDPLLTEDGDYIILD